MCFGFRKEEQDGIKSRENATTENAELAARPVTVATSVPIDRRYVALHTPTPFQSILGPQDILYDVNDISPAATPPYDPDSKFCRKCQGLDWDRMANNGGYSHHDIPSLKREAEKSDGCPLCRMMWTSLLHRKSEESLWEFKVNLHLFPQDNPFTRWGDSKDDLITDLYVSCVEKNSIKCWNPRGGIWTTGTHLSISVDREQPYGKYFKYKTVGPSSGSDQTIRYIKQWDHDCVEQHEKCQEWRQKRNGTLPTRLIDVGPADGSVEPRVVISKTLPKPSKRDQDKLSSRGIKYTALSYCWGTKPALTSTSVTLKDRLKGLPMEDLPKTIRDAVTVTRSLGIRYIWVDALCIIQGSNPDAVADWLRESSNMRNIYQQAYITIAGSASPDVYHGLFLDYEAPELPILQLPFFSARREEAKGTLSISLHKDILDDPDSITDPLDKRAWTLQEAALSPRILRFRKNEVVWECTDFKTSDSAVKIDFVSKAEIARIREEIELDGGRRMRNYYPGGVFERSPEDEANNQIDTWHWLVGNYTARALTNGTDKLPALSGLVRERVESEGDVYVAGLWKKMLLHNLLWFTGKNDIGIAFQPNGRPETYRAPSWSWASVDGNVCFVTAEGEYTEGFAAEVVSYEVTPKGVDPYGQISGGWMKLRGPVSSFSSSRLVKSEVQFPGNAGGFQTIDTIGFFVTDGQVEIHAIHPDVMEEVEAIVESGIEVEIYCLLLRGAEGLVLRRKEGGKGGEEEFVRLGVFVFGDRRYLSTFMERTMVVV